MDPIASESPIGPAPVLVCLCRHYDFIDAVLRDRLVDRLTQAGAPVVLVDDLCAAIARRDPAVAEAAAAGPLRIAACHPRAVRWLLDTAGVDAPADVDVLDLRSVGAEQVDAWPADLAPAGESAPPCEVRADDDWPGWFPVIDYDLCTQCRKCLSFCLFDVYALQDDGVVVKNPAKCKANCPACARVCPHTAIIFPKYHSEPINGAPVAEAPAADKPAGVDVTDLKTTDVYAALRRRSAEGGGPRRRFSPGAPGAPGKAASDTDKADHLRNLQQELDIPDEVLDSLRGPKKPREGRHHP